MSHGVLLLDPHAAHAFDVTGNGVVQIAGDIGVNSDSATAGFLVGNAVARANDASFSGQYLLNGNARLLASHVRSGAPHFADPLRFLAVPSLITLTVRSHTTRQISNGNVTLAPGIYHGGIHLSGRANVTMLPGIYFLTGGGFTVTGQANLSGQGVMFYNEAITPNDRIQIAGQGRVTLSAMTSGAYANLLVYQRRQGLARLQITGNGNFNLQGGIYAAGADALIAGNGDMALGSLYISRGMSVHGNGEVRIGGNGGTPWGCPGN